MVTNDVHNRWKIVPSESGNEKSVAEKEELVNQLIREYNLEKRTKKIKKLSIDNPEWDELQLKELTSMVNYLLYLGVTIEDSVSIISKLKDKLYKNSSDFRDVTRIKDHIKSMAGLYMENKKPKPFGLCFESTDSIDALKSKSYVRVTGLWSNRSKKSNSTSTTTNHKKEIAADTMKNSSNDIFNFFATQGYMFSREIISRYYLSLSTKPFVILTGISGTGKTKIAQVFAEYMCGLITPPEERKKHIAFISVRPDWTDNKGLLGYYNLLDGHYQATRLIRLLLDASNNPDQPYFVVLDEMNLARVEYYFSDFLSIMESRTKDHPEGENIKLHDLPVATTVDGLEIPQIINIPSNIFFTGTVNVDESTYMFSPKVLDRANVIEFNEINLDNYKKNIYSRGTFTLKEYNLLKNTFPSNTELFCSRDDYLKYITLLDGKEDTLTKLIETLQKYHLHFGYRVVNEISRFIWQAKEMVQQFSVDEAMDIQILQKILPKFHGTQAKLEEPLNELKGYFKERFRRSMAKVKRMSENLKAQGYTSFIE